jgi:hypothetical protein
VAEGRARDGRWLDAPASWRAVDPGPGEVSVATGPGGVTVRRTIGFASSGLDALRAELHDLRVAETLADLAARHHW